MREVSSLPPLKDEEHIGGIPVSNGVKAEIWC